MKCVILFLIILLSNNIVVSQTTQDTKSKEEDLWTKLFDVSDESAKSIAKSANEDGSAYSVALKEVVGGAGTYDDLVSYVSKQGGSVKTVDDIATYIRSKPDLLKTIATSSDVIMKRAAENLFANSGVKSLFDPTSWNVVNKLLKSENPNAIGSALRQLEQYKGKNTELDELIKKLEDRKSIAENMKSTSKTENEITEPIKND